MTDKECYESEIAEERAKSDEDCKGCAYWYTLQDGEQGGFLPCSDCPWASHL